jgi:hypothetical protein
MRSRFVAVVILVDETPDRLRPCGRNPRRANPAAAVPVVPQRTPGDENRGPWKTRNGTGNGGMVNLDYSGNRSFKDVSIGKQEERDE